MNSLVKGLTNAFGHTNPSFSSGNHLQQQWRGIRVRVINGNLEGALAFMQRKMTASGMERLIRKQTRFHLKNSEKRVLARKNLERRIRAQEFSQKLRSIIIKKLRGF